MTTHGLIVKNAFRVRRVGSRHELSHRCPSGNEPSQPVSGAGGSLGTTRLEQVDEPD